MRRFFRKLFGTEATARHVVRTAFSNARLGVTSLEDRVTPADLVPILGAPSVVAPGETVNGVFGSFNVGTIGGGTSTDRVQLSADPVASADDITLGSFTFSGTLPQGGGFTAPLSGSVPANVPFGMRFLIGTSDAQNQFPESNEANNVRVSPVAIVPASVAPQIRTVAGQLGTALGAALVPTATTNNSVTFGLNSSATYRIGGFTITNLQATVTVSAAGAVSITGTANLQVPTGGGSTVVVPINFSGNSTSFSVSGTASIASLQLGTNPQVVATNATITANLTVQLASSAVSGSVQASAASVSLRSGAVTLLVASNFQGTFNSAGAITATASSVSVLSGRANAASVSFTFNYATNRITGNVGSVTGAIGSITMSASNMALVIDPGSGDPLLSVGSASMSIPMNGSAVNLTATGFRVSQNGRFQFDSLALTIPSQTVNGFQITSTFAGEVRISGTTVFVELEGSARVFNTNVEVDGTLTANSQGLFGGLTVRTTGGSTALVLGQSLGFTYEGTATLMVNTTTVARTITSGGATRTVAANAARLVASGELSASGFTLAGVIDIAASANGTAQVFANAELSLGQFGLFQTTGSGLFQFTNGGLVGSLGVTQVTFPGGGIELRGALSLRVNTTAATANGIAPGAVIRAADGVRVGGHTLSAQAEVGFRNNPGTSNDFYFASVSGQVSLYNGTLTSNVSGEVRSNGFVSLSGTTTLTLSESQTGGTGLSMVVSGTATLTRAAGSNGAVSASASLSGAVYWFGLEVIEASVSINSSGIVTVDGEVFGFGILHWEFDLTP